MTFDSLLNSNHKRHSGSKTDVIFIKLYSKWEVHAEMYLFFIILPPPCCSKPVWLNLSTQMEMLCRFPKLFFCKKKKKSTSYSSSKNISWLYLMKRQTCNCYLLKILPFSNSFLLLFSVWKKETWRFCPTSPFVFNREKTKTHTGLKPHEGNEIKWWQNIHFHLFKCYTFTWEVLVTVFFSFSMFCKLISRLKGSYNLPSCVFLVFFSVCRRRQWMM